jgi:condensin complex subunit 1
MNKKRANIDEILEGKKVSEHFEEYLTIAESGDRSVLRLVSQNSNDSHKSLKVVYKLVLSLSEDFSFQFVEEVIGVVKKLVHATSKDPRDDGFDEEIVQICFALFEKIALFKKSSDFVDLVFEISGGNFDSANLSSYLVSLLSIENSGPILERIVSESNIRDFLSMSLTQKDPTILKNFASLLPTLYDKFPQHVDTKKYAMLLDSEHVFLRSSYLEVLLKDVLRSIREKRYETICDSILTIAQRMIDTNYFVRTKALSLLSQIFEEKVMPNEIRNSILEMAIERIVDKTQIVRKKALKLCCIALMNHPFHMNGASLEKIKDTSNQYAKDLNQFHDVIASALKSIDYLLKLNCKSEIDEICEFLKLCYFYKIDQTIKTFELLFYYNVYDRDALDKIVYHLADLFSRAKKRRFEFFSQFGHSDALEIVIKELAKRRTFKEDTFDSIFGMVKAGMKSLFYFLSCSIKYLEVDSPKILELVDFVSNVFFMSKSEAELRENIVLYRNMLDMVVNFKDKELNSELIALLVKNYAKMNFFDYEISEKTLKICFKSGHDYEKNLVSLLKVICTKNVNKLKVLHAIGCIAFEQGNIIDMMEIKAKKMKSALGQVVPNEVRERRRSINVSRMSLQARVSDAVEAQAALDNIIDKPEDEIADILFFVKEREILFGNSLLQPFVPFLIGGCKDPNAEVQKVAYLSLLKCMSISSEFFEKNIALFFAGLTHKNCQIRNNCVVAMHDYFVSYNFLLEREIGALFDMLYDPEGAVRTNAVLIVFDLLVKNVIKPKGHSPKLSQLLVDEDEEIAGIAFALFQKISKNENTIATIFYESLLYVDLDMIKKILVILLPLVSEKIKETCFAKLLRYRETKSDILRFYLQNATFSERFIAEMSTFEDFNELRK